MIELSRSPPRSIDANMRGRPIARTSTPTIASCDRTSNCKFGQRRVWSSWRRYDRAAWTQGSSISCQSLIRKLDQLLVASQHVELAAPKGHPVTRLKKLKLRDLVDAPFV